MDFSLIKRHAALLVVGLLYGANYSIAKMATPDFLEPFGFIVIRVFFGGLFIWIIGLSIRERIQWKADGMRIFLCSFFGVGINMLFFFKGVSITTAINSSLIMTVTPLLVYGLSVLILHETPKRLKVFGLLLGLSGACLIMYRPGYSVSEGNWVGDLFIFFNAASYGTYLVLVKPLLAKYHPITIAKWIFLIGFFIVLPVGFTEMIQFEPTTWPPFVWFSVGYVVLGVTVTAYLTNIWAMRKVSPGTIGAYIYVQPVFAAAIAIFLFGEVFTWRHAIATLLVFAGVGLVIYRPATKK